MRNTTIAALAAGVAVLALPAAAQAKARHHHHMVKAKADHGLSSAEQLHMAQEQIAGNQQEE